MTRALVLALTVLTGFAGLVYEVAWQKYLATLLGSHSEATAAVLALFLGGLSAGYAGFGRVSRRLAARAGEASADATAGARALGVYGVVEAAIGIWALLFPLAFAAVRALSLWLPASLPGVAFALDVALSALLIVPPAVLMGGTIPLLTQALARSLDDSTRIHALIYAANTAGAFAGALAAGFALVPALGLAGCVRAMGVLNLAVGASFVALARRGGGPAAAPAQNSPASAPANPPSALAPLAPRKRAAFAAAALLAGFALMTLQTTLNRVGALSLGASHFTFAIVVASFVLCIALGSVAVAAFARIHWSALVVSQWALVLILLALYPHVADAPYYAHWMRALFASQDPSFYPYQLAIFAAVFAIWCAPLALSGAMLPLLFHHLRGEVDDLGGVAGRLYSWNTAGSLAGALLGGYALLHWLDLHHVYRLSAIALGAGAALLTAVIRPRLAPAGALLLAGVVIVTASQPTWDARKLSSGAFRLREAGATTPLGAEVFFADLAQRNRDADALLFYDDDPMLSVAVVQSRIADRPTRSIVVNGKSDGNIPTDNQTTGLLALLPALFSARAERAFVIGYGAGMSVGELAALESMREVVVAEISNAVMDAAPLFESVNRGALADPKTRVIRSDAYRALLRSEGEYDVIVSEPSNPWVTGVENVFALEFLAAAKRRLRPGGVYAQWFQNYETNAESIALVLNTYRAVFERVSIWAGKADDLILLGFDERTAPPDIDALVRALARGDFQRQLEAIGIKSIAALLAHEVVPEGVLHAAQLPVALHTLHHPRLSHAAARGFFGGRAARLPAMLDAEAVRVGAEHSLLRAYVARFPGGLPDAQRAAFAREVCALDERRCATTLAAWRHVAPHSDALRELLAAARAEAALRDELSDDRLGELTRLFDAASFADAPQSYASARELTQRFAEYYDYAVPFDPQVLSDAWWRCTGDERCESFGARFRAFGAARAAAAQLPR